MYREKNKKSALQAKRQSGSYRYVLSMMLLLFPCLAICQDTVVDTASWFVGQKQNDVLLERVSRSLQAKNGEGDGVAATYKDGRMKSFDRFWGAATVGTTGFGIDISSPVTQMVNLRAGFSIMPSLKTTMHFHVGVGDKDPKYDKDGNRIETKFERLSKAFEQVTGMRVNENVEMIGRPTFWNVHLLADVYCFPNKKWHLTGGFYLGNRQIAKAYNSTRDMNALLTVCIYNTLYDKVINAVEDPWNIDNEVLLMEYGNAAIVLDQDKTETLYKYMKRYGRMGFHLGDYWVEPDEDGMMKCKVTANPLKPYLGFGYGDATPEKGKWVAFSLDAGLLFWGGTPRVDCYGTDLVDMHVRGRVGSYIDFISTLKAYPVINLKVAVPL